jgi:hypothetical protein
MIGSRSRKSAREEKLRGFRPRFPAQQILYLFSRAKSILLTAKTGRSARHNQIVTLSDNPGNKTL